MEWNEFAKRIKVGRVSSTPQADALAIKCLRTEQTISIYFHDSPFTLYPFFFTLFSLRAMQQWQR